MAISKFVMILLPFEWVVKEIYITRQWQAAVTVTQPARWSSSSACRGCR